MMETKTDQIVKAATAFLNKRKDVLFAYLFGSHVKGGTSRMSDIDIAVYMDEEHFSKADILQLIQEMSDDMHTDALDLVVLNKAPLTLIYRILENHVILIDRTPPKRHLFESLSMRKYFDFSYMENAILERRYG